METLELLIFKQLLVKPEEKPVRDGQGDDQAPTVDSHFEISDPVVGALGIQVVQSNQLFSLQITFDHPHFTQKFQVRLKEVKPSGVLLEA